MGAEVIILANPYTYNFIKGLTHSALWRGWKMHFWCIFIAFLTSQDREVVTNPRYFMIKLQKTVNRINWGLPFFSLKPSPYSMQSSSSKSSLFPTNTTTTKASSHLLLKWAPFQLWFRIYVFWAPSNVVNVGRKIYQYQS